MAKCVNGEFSLPEPIIQHIQSFLSCKEAAQTSIFSKSWYTAWLTRPNLHFDQRDFRRSQPNAFAEFTNTTLQRYQDLNLQIESFKLRIRRFEEAAYSLATALIVKAIQIGATDLDFQVFPDASTFSLPPEVFGSETLTRLSVQGCKIKNVEVRCSRLKSLFLREVWLEGDMILNVLASCPLIEVLELPKCNFPYNYTVRAKRRILALSHSFEIEKQNLRSGVDGRVNNLFELHRLKSLILKRVNISTLFFSDFLTKFPCLKNLDVHYCSGYRKIQIHSPSLEFITFAQKPILKLKANFNVPNIREFKFSSSSLLPSLNFQTPSSKGWVSDIYISCQSPSYSWFLKLNKLLTNLSSSTIDLSLDFQGGYRSFDFTGDVEVLPVVQNLRMHATYPVCYDILDCIFWSCRPMFIIVSRLPGLVEEENERLLALLYDTLTQERREAHPYLNDLREVSIDEEILANQEPLEQATRFQLKWEMESSTSI